MTTWTQLQTDFPAWSKRSDQTAQLPGFVSLVESRFNRRLRTRQQETAFTGTIDAGGELALPTGFLAMKAVWLSGSQAQPLDAQSLDYITANRSLESQATAFAVGASSLAFDGSGDVKGVYFKAIPGLVADGSNWLSLMAYEAYLFGALAEAALYSFDAERAAAYYGRADALISELISNDQRDRFSGPLISRKR